jgi:predicted nucleic acid-binding protein
VIVVDTSVWVTAMRASRSPEGRALAALLDADEVALAVPVRLELLSGASRRDRPALRRALSALPVLYPTDATWTLMDRWVERAGNAHERFGVGDLLIAALAAELGALVWSLDSDFDRMHRLGLVDLYEP